MIAVAAMVMISAKLTGVMLAVVPPVSIGAVIYGRYLRKLSKQTQEALGEMSKVSPYATSYRPGAASGKTHANDDLV